MAPPIAQQEGFRIKPEYDTTMTIGCLLAGGQSRRMGGGDKCLLPLGGCSMLAHAAARLAPQVASIVLSANGDPRRFSAYDFPVIADPVEGYAGPLAGVLAGLRWAGAHAPAAIYVATAASDTPFFPEDLVARMVDATGGDPKTIALAASGGRAQPVFGLWPIALADHLTDWLERGESRKVLDWVACHASVEVAFDGAVVGDADIDPFFNINTPADMEKASDILKERQE